MKYQETLETLWLAWHLQRLPAGQHNLLCIACFKPETILPGWARFSAVSVLSLPELRAFQAYQRAETSPGRATQPCYAACV